MERCLSIPRHGPHSPTWSHGPSHLGVLRFWLWLHQKVQGPGQELRREPGKRTKAVSQGRLGLVTKRAGCPRRSPGSLDLGTEGSAGWVVLILEGRTITVLLWGTLKRM